MSFDNGLLYAILLAGLWWLGFFFISRSESSPLEISNPLEREIRFFSFVLSTMLSDSFLPSSGLSFFYLDLSRINGFGLK